MKKRQKVKRARTPRDTDAARRARSAEPPLTIQTLEPANEKARSIVAKFILGLTVTTLLTMTKLAFEATRFGKELEQMTVNLLQLRLTDAAGRQPTRVAVVDASDLIPIRVDTPGHPELVTPRKELSEIINATAQADPAAIGIDIIFQPDDNGRLSADDQRFLDFCLHLKNSRGVRIPTFVGIYDSIVRGPAGWLGDEGFSTLGASIAVPRSEGSEPTTRMPSMIRIHGQDGDIVAPSLSYALMRSLITEEASRRWLGTRLHRFMPGLVVSEITKRGEDLEAQEFAIDFSDTSNLVASAVRAKRASDVEQDAARLRGKVVLVGRGDGKDQFTIPGRGEPVPGVYVHAAAVSTLLEAPLYSLTKAGRVVADIVVAVIPLAIILFLERSHARRASSTNTAEMRSWPLAIGMSVVIVMLGYFWIDWTGILWTDFLMVIGALFFHQPAEELIERVRQWMPHCRGIHR